MTSNLNATLGSIRYLVKHGNSYDAVVLTRMRKASDQIMLTLDQISSEADILETSLAPDAPFTYQLGLVLENFSEASSAIRELADDLQRNPSAIVRGRSSQAQR
jgi:paraquat-inducible protein B